MTAPALPPGVVYKPGHLHCHWTWRHGDFGDPPILEEIDTHCPTWSITGEDGTIFNVFREGGEVNAWIDDPDGRRRTAWDLGQPRRHTPLGRSDHLPASEQATDIELAVMNRILRPVALESGWADELAAMIPCPHNNRYCERNKELR